MLRRVRRKVADDGKSSERRQNVLFTYSTIPSTFHFGAGGGLGDMFRLIDSDDSKGISFKEFKTFTKIA